jgi:serine/threonine-protein kinase
VVDIAAQVADGLWFAHQQDIVHRDVKPSNIMVLKGGIAKITDFGIARLPNSAVKTMTGLILGSPRYMSPEQVIGKSLDKRTDIFSLGVVLYESLTGEAPFDGDNVNAIMYATVNSSPPPPSSRNRLVPAMLDLIVAKAMAKVVDDRYQTIKEFADDLREVRRQLDASRPSIALKATTAPPPAPPGARDLLAGLGSQTTPLTADGKHDRGPMSEEEAAKALALAKTFDSFDATLRLAAMTNQTDEFEEYITATQKMRAYRGKIEAHSPLAALKNPVLEEQPAGESPRMAAARARDAEERVATGGGSNLPALIAIGILAVVAIALLVALVVK